MSTNSQYRKIERATNDASASASRNDWKRSVALAVLLLVLALAYTASRDAHAVTYKWVDEKGVVNYSNSPPPAASSAKKSTQVAEVVEDRLSTYESDPALRRSAAFRGAPSAPDYAQIEWLQRQRYLMDMATAQAAARVDCDYRNDCRSAYTYPYLSLAVVRPARVRPTFFTSGSRVLR